jgi:hypothetical protein
MIQPTYVTFEQAKKLKELGLSAKSDKYWVMMTKDEYTEMSDVQLEDLDYSIGIGGNLVITKYQQWQVVEWLKVQHGIWVFPEYQFGRKKWLFNITLLNYFDEALKIQEQYYKDLGEVDYDTTQEAYSAAFDYVLNNLI